MWDVLSIFPPKTFSVTTDFREDPRVQTLGPPISDVPLLFGQVNANLWESEGKTLRPRKTSKKAKLIDPHLSIDSAAKFGPAISTGANVALSRWGPSHSHDLCLVNLPP